VEGRYDFQDLVSLRTIAELSRHGVPLRTIGRTVRRLASVLPDIERPLAQLKLVEESGALLAEVGDALLSADGQLLLSFGERTEPECGGALTLAEPKDARGGASAGDWIDYGHDLEEDEQFEEAVAAYRRALALRPQFAAAHFNLGNALRSLERLEAAEEHLLMAVTQDPSLAVAWYNLADVQEERGRLGDAIASLRSALAIDPAFADAHYNLALCYERAGDSERARAHWRRYLEIDPHSPWAESARARFRI
jgi:tetratricopeptide (TPR) repeat protein